VINLEAGRQQLATRVTLPPPARGYDITLPRRDVPPLVLRHESILRVSNLEKQNQFQRATAMITPEQRQVMQDNYPFYIALDMRTGRRELRQRLATELGLKERQVVTFMCDHGRRLRGTLGTSTSGTDDDSGDSDGAQPKRRRGRGRKRKQAVVTEEEGVITPGGDELVVTLEDILGESAPPLEPDYADDDFMRHLNALFPPPNAEADDSLFEF
jgi:hypothetical protein